VASKEEPGGIENQKGSDDGSSQHDNLTGRHTGIGSSLVSESKKPAGESSDTQTERDARPKTKWTRSDIGIFLTAFGTILLAVFAYLAWSEAIKGTRIARSQLVFSQRAFVFFPLVQFVPYPPENPTVWGVTVIASNTGNTPARTMQIRFGCPDHPENKTIKPDPFTLSRWEGAGVEPPTFLGPRHRVPLQACNIDIGRINAAKRNEINLFIVAEAKYVDAFGNPQITQMTRIVYFDKTGRASLGFIGEHNCTDEDCSDQKKRNSSQPP
jgi:hypothetical protein